MKQIGVMRSILISLTTKSVELVVVFAVAACSRPTPVPQPTNGSVVAATPFLTMTLPSPATPIFAPVSASSIGAIGYEVPGSQVIVQRDVLDGGCADHLNYQRKVMDSQFSDSTTSGDLQLRVVPATGGEPNILLATGRQRFTPSWFALAELMTCNGPESLIITVTSTVDDDPNTIAKVGATALLAARSLKRAGADPSSARVAATADLTILLPQPFSLLRTETSSDAVPTRSYKTPGAAEFSVSQFPERSPEECAAWLVAMGDETDRVLKSNQKAFGNIVSEKIEQETVGPTHEKLLFLFMRQQLPETSIEPGAWYAKISGVFCMGGTPLLFTAVSFEGESMDGNVPNTVKLRLRSMIKSAVTSLQPS